MRVCMRGATANGNARASDAVTSGGGILRGYPRRRPCFSRLYMDAVRAREGIVMRLMTWAFIGAALVFLVFGAFAGYDALGLIEEGATLLWQSGL